MGKVRALPRVAVCMCGRRFPVVLISFEKKIYFQTLLFAFINSSPFAKGSIPLKAFFASMPLRRAIENFLAKVREEEELAFNQRPSSLNNQHHLPPLPQRMEGEGSSGSNPPPHVPALYMRRLEDRVEQLEREIPRLTQEINSLRRRLASVTAERDRLQAEVNRLRRRG